MSGCSQSLSVEGVALPDDLQPPVDPGGGADQVDHHRPFVTDSHDDPSGIGVIALQPVDRLQH
jgi:hypothetical protein